MKKALLLLLLLPFTSCVEMQQIINQLPSPQGIGSVDISGGLKEALNNGITKDRKSVV